MNAEQIKFELLEVGAPILTSKKVGHVQVNNSLILNLLIPSPLRLEK